MACSPANPLYRSLIIIWTMLWIVKLKLGDSIAVRTWRFDCTLTLEKHFKNLCNFQVAQVDESEWANWTMLWKCEVI